MGTETHQSEPKEVGDLLNNKIIAIDTNADQSFAVTSKKYILYRRSYIVKIVLLTLKN